MPSSKPPENVEQLEREAVASPEARGQRRRGVWVLAICVRLACAFTVATFFQPDEYYQSLEPAWQLLFGQNSGAWITWEWDNQLRSSLHPVIIAALYYVVAVFGWTMSLPMTLRAQMLLFAPKVLHASFAAALDVSTWRLAEILFGDYSVESNVALALSLLTPWQWFAGPRSLTNGLEASLTSIALVRFPWSWIILPETSSKRAKELSRVKYCVMLAATAAMLRPTNVIIWAVLTLCLFLHATQSEILAFSQDLAVYGTAVLATSYGMDRLYYGVWTFPAGRFLYFNLSQDLAVFYGRNRPDYYFTEGLPILLTLASPFAITGIVQAFVPSFSSQIPSHPDPKAHAAVSVPPNKQAAFRTLATTALIYPSILSLISHKEVRFLYPLLPLLLVLEARPLTTYFLPSARSANLLRRLLFFTLIALSVAFTAYISNVHQRGPLTVISYLRSRFVALNADALILGTKEYTTPLTSFFGHTSLLALLSQSFRSPYQPSATTPQPLKPLSAAFLMPCHSTPWRSHLIYPEIHAWALTCEPPLNVPLSERSTYLDEADIFYADPATWLHENMDVETLPSSDVRAYVWSDNGWDRENVAQVADVTKGVTLRPKRPWPRYLIMFEQLEPLIREFLQEEDNGSGSGYEVCWRGFNSHWHDDRRRRGGIVVLCVGGSLDLVEVVGEYDKVVQAGREREFHELL